MKIYIASPNVLLQREASENSNVGRKNHMHVQVCLLAVPYFWRLSQKSFFPLLSQRNKIASMKVEKKKKIAQLKYDTAYEQSMTNLWKCTHYSIKTNLQLSFAMRWKCYSFVFFHFNADGMAYIVLVKRTYWTNWHLCIRRAFMDDTIKSLFLSMNETWNSIQTDTSGRDCINNNPVAVAHIANSLPFDLSCVPSIYIQWPSIIALLVKWRNVHHSLMALHS